METPKGLVVFRLKRSQRLAKLARADSLLLPVMFTIIESGVLYSSAMISVIATYATGNNAQYIILEMVRSDLSGTCFTALNHIVLFTLQLTPLIVSLSSSFANINVSAKLHPTGHCIHLDNCPSWARNQLKRKRHNSISAIHWHSEFVHYTRVTTYKR
jgi:hypothetical protein